MRFYPLKLVSRRLNIDGLVEATVDRSLIARANIDGDATMGGNVAEFETMRELLRRFRWTKADMDDTGRETYFPPDGWGWASANWTDALVNPWANDRNQNRTSCLPD